MITFASANLGNGGAAANPKKVKEMQDLLWQELRKYPLLPLDAAAVKAMAASQETGAKTDFYAPQ